MEPMLRKGLRKYHGLRQQIDNVLLGDDGDEWEAEMRKFLARRPCWVKNEKERSNRSDFLILLDPVTITLAEEHNPDEFFKTRSGLRVSDDFRRLVVAKVQPSKAGTSYRLNRAKLAKHLTDTKIKSALPASLLFSGTQVCAIIASLITDQPGGKKGILLNNGYANLFYTMSCVVYVYWDIADCEWYVDVGPCNGHQWLAGRRVFSSTIDD